MESVTKFSLTSVLDATIRSQDTIMTVLMAIIVATATTNLVDAYSPYALQIEPYVKFIALLFVLPLYLLGLRHFPKTFKLELPPFIRKSPENKHLLLFLHGWMGDSKNTWERFPELIKQDSQFTSFDILSLPYPTYMFRRSLDLPALVSWLVDNLQRAASLDKYESIAIIAHSMGGLVARELYLQSKLANENVPIKLIIAIGTPHSGTDVATLASSLGIGATLIQDLAPGSKFLSTLKTHWNMVKDRPETHGISSPQDEIVNEDSAHALCDRFFSYPQWSHKEMVKPDSIQDERYSKPTSIVLKKVSQN